MNDVTSTLLDYITPELAEHLSLNILLVDRDIDYEDYNM